MVKRRAVPKDPMDQLIEEAFEPGEYLWEYDPFSLILKIKEVEAEVAKLVRADPRRTIGLYEKLLAGCDAAMEEMDDSDGEFVAYAGSLYQGWIKARQAADADRTETALLLLRWIEEDGYGICDDLPASVVKVLDRAGLEAFECEVRARFDRERLSPGNSGRWGEMLKNICAHRRDLGKYIDVIEQAGLTRADCGILANMLLARRKPDEALTWVERGLALGKTSELDELRRSLLVKVGRGGEALDSAWAEFQAYPGKDTYEVLLRYVPRAKRRAWHEKAMEVSEQAGLNSVIPLWLRAKEFDRLAARLERTTDKALEGLSHYVTEPAAERLAKTHPRAAAKVYRALCMRIVDAGKSTLYFAALSSVEKAKKCYERAGLDAQWQSLVREIRSKHRRKSGFMPGFERIVGDSVPGGKVRPR